MFGIYVILYRCGVVDHMVDLICLSFCLLAMSDLVVLLYQAATGFIRSYYVIGLLSCFTLL